MNTLAANITETRSNLDRATSGRTTLGRATLRRSFPWRGERLGWGLALPVLLLALAGNVPAQVNSGSDGHDGAFNPTTSTVVNTPVVWPGRNTYFQPETVI